MNKNPFSIILFIFLAPLILSLFAFTGGTIPFIIIVFLIVSASKNNNNNANKLRSSKLSRPSGNNDYKLSNRDRAKIDTKLTKYFNENITLPVVNDIALTTKNGRYTAVEDLYISLGGELVLSMDEFKNYYPDMYSRICSLLLSFSKQSDEVLKADVKAPEPKVEDKLSDAQKYIDKINDLNVDIPNEEIKNGLYQTSALLKQIELYASEDDQDKLTKLYDYYLPILTKILENYKNLAKVGMSGDEFKNTEVQLIKTIILINEVLKELNKTIHEDDYMDLSADITTLQSLLKKDGLVSNPFQKEDEDDGQE